MQFLDDCQGGEDYFSIFDDFMMFKRLRLINRQENVSLWKKVSKIAKMSQLGLFILDFGR